MRWPEEGCFVKRGQQKTHVANPCLIKNREWSLRLHSLGEHVYEALNLLPTRRGALKNSVIVWPASHETINVYLKMAQRVVRTLFKTWGLHRITVDVDQPKPCQLESSLSSYIHTLHAGVRGSDDKTHEQTERAQTPEPNHSWTSLAQPET